MKSKKEALRFSFWQTITLVLLAVLLTFWGTQMFLGGTPLPMRLLQKNISSRVTTISPTEFKDAIDKKDFILINVHTPYEGEIAKTDVFIDYDKLDQNQDKLPKDKSAKIVLYCQSGRMSETAAKKLVDLGYTNVSHLAGGMEALKKVNVRTFNAEELKKQVLPESGFSAPVKWGNLGPTLVSIGVIDLEKFKKLGNLTEEQLALLTKSQDQPININEKNTQFVVDILWALGLAQKSKVYTDGPMGKEYKDKAGNFASTGGWTIGKKAATSYLNKYEIIQLNSEQQNRVFEISQNIYRPCCGNHTAFPDCNHGMAALGLVELMVSQNFSDEEIYKTVLGFNSFWFAQNYLALAALNALDGVSWDKVDAKKALSQEFSSAQGTMQVTKKVGGLPYLYRNQGGGCGV